MRFYSFLVNALHSQSVLVLANLVGKVADMMGSMVRGVIYSKTEAESGGAVSVNLDAGYVSCFGRKFRVNLIFLSVDYQRH